MERSQNKEARPTNVENSRGMGQTYLQLGMVLKFNISYFFDRETFVQLLTIEFYN